jgi:hypothetical protein
MVTEVVKKMELQLLAFVTNFIVEKLAKIPLHAIFTVILVSMELSVKTGILSLSAVIVSTTFGETNAMAFQAVQSIIHA